MSLNGQGQCRNPPCFWQDLVQKSEPLYVEFGGPHHHASDVSAWPRNARRESCSNGIAGGE